MDRGKHGGEIYNKLRDKTVALPARNADIIRAYNALTEAQAHRSRTSRSPLTLQEHLIVLSPYQRSIMSGYEHLGGKRMVSAQGQVTRSHSNWGHRASMRYWAMELATM